VEAGMVTAEDDAHGATAKHRRRAMATGSPRPLVD
jgi:hypothetical protein